MRYTAGYKPMKKFIFGVLAGLFLALLFRHIWWHYDFVDNFLDNPLKLSIIKLWS